MFTFHITPFTIEQLFEELERLANNPIVTALQITYDETLGYPNFISIKHPTTITTTTAMHHPTIFSKCAFHNSHITCSYKPNSILLQPFGSLLYYKIIGTFRTRLFL